MKEKILLKEKELYKDKSYYPSIKKIIDSKTFPIMFSVNRSINTDEEEEKFLSQSKEHSYKLLRDIVGQDEPLNSTQINRFFKKLKEVIYLLIIS
jgi:hypothetical protein